MKISTGLQRVFEDAQLVAQRYACDYLETWHVLSCLSLSTMIQSLVLFWQNILFQFLTMNMQLLL